MDKAWRAVLEEITNQKTVYKEKIIYILNETKDNHKEPFRGVIKLIMDLENVRIDLKIEDKAFILLSSLPNSYEHL